jgi:hypothetical protein
MKLSSSSVTVSSKDLGSVQFGEHTKLISKEKKRSQILSTSFRKRENDQVRIPKKKKEEERSGRKLVGGSEVGNISTEKFQNSTILYFPMTYLGSSQRIFLFLQFSPWEKDFSLTLFGMGFSTQPSIEMDTNLRRIVKELSMKGYSPRLTLHLHLGKRGSANQLELTRSNPSIPLSPRQETVSLIFPPATLD